ncbi:DUF3021 domain-containing protein [Lactiplantibacillus plantarum]|uniref:DUF3021 domain-containing protein n=1 Tax=Lactiplantibacillus plantarum TaxID=1590 RepID=UPI00077E183C|nr:DUF3021 domain-containing protein [Lactiplantibacillus plantarum]AMR18568.1 hypothetical protein AZF39_00565 [Lactiplantibacillus plantarum]MDB7771003.1 DUF3021 domain-containing protein [Lactiplantibacillus plantarum]MDN7027310.1 DUF3021 domain-containing protein [Lactiplantibacillus plantarum]QIA85654.1 DUF3021 domain-containing protein [Lactiplantibacillus plantarum]QTL11168.1 DUF3021 domain-containing protein [Lactiplantibacillus plantarum]
MKTIIKTSLYGMQLGVIFGLFWSLVFSYSFNANTYYASSPVFYENFSRPLNAVLVSIILWGAMGLVFSLGSLIFTFENWSLLKRTVVNFIIYYCGFTPLAILAGWFPLNGYWLITFTLIFIGIYIAIWCLNAINTRKQITKINQSIKNNKQL